MVVCLFETNSPVEDIRGRKAAGRVDSGARMPANSEAENRGTEGRWRIRDSRKQQLIPERISLSNCGATGWRWRICGSRVGAQ